MLILELLAWLYGAKRPTRRSYLLPGQIICPRCKGAGAVHVGAAWPLSCHYCEDGVTTQRYVHAQRDWEQRCYIAETPRPESRSLWRFPTDGSRQLRTRDEVLNELEEARQARRLIAANPLYRLYK